MDTMGTRIKKIIVYNGSTMTSFAKELNISQSMVSKICADKATPSERTISDICRIYNIHREWLMHGTGEMIDAPSLESELTEVFKDALPNHPDIKRDFISTLASLPPAAWPMVTDYVRKVAEEYKHNPHSADPYMAGYRDGLRAAQSVKELIENLSADPKE